MPKTSFLTLLCLLIGGALIAKTNIVWQETQRSPLDSIVNPAEAQLLGDKKKETESLVQDTPGELSLEERLRLGEIPEELLRQLSEREKGIKEREQSLVRLESILGIAKKRAQDRQEALEATRSEIKTLIGQYEEIRNEENTRLVSIYSNIEPKRAAVIFNDLDVDITVQLMRTMSPRRVAPILAEMNTEKARLITQLLSDE